MPTYIRETFIIPDPTPDGEDHAECYMSGNGKMIIEKPLDPRYGLILLNEEDWREMKLFFDRQFYEFQNQEPLINSVMDVKP